MPLYKRIAVASTFSPRFLPLLREGKRLAEVMGGSLSVIHAGEHSREAEGKFEAAFRDIGTAPEVHWGAGETPSAAIRAEAERHGIDLLVAGAMEREAPGRSFVGDVARALMREARCSLLLLPKPSATPEPIRQIAVLTDFSERSAGALRRGIALAEAEKAEGLHAIRIYTVFAQALAQVEITGKGEGENSHLVADEEKRLEEFVKAAGPTRVPIKTFCVEGTTGFAASDYVQSVGAQLLVIPSGPPGTEPQFPSGSDWILDVIPANLLVARDGEI